MFGGWLLPALVTVVLPLGSLIMKLLNVSLTDFLWVSKGKFNQITENLRDAVGSVATALGRVRTELMARIDVVDRAVMDTRHELKTGLSEVNNRVDAVEDTVKANDVAQTQRVEEIRDAVQQSEQRLAEQLDRIEVEGTSTHQSVQRLEATFKESERRLAAHIDRIESGLKIANRGIWLLCGVVAEHQQGNNSGGRSAAAVVGEHALPDVASANNSSEQQPKLTMGAKAGFFKELSQYAQHEFVLGGIQLGGGGISNAGATKTANPDVSGGLETMRKELLKAGVMSSTSQ
jgi:hypothetical protein